MYRGDSMVKNIILILILFVSPAYGTWFNKLGRLHLHKNIIKQSVQINPKKVLKPIALLSALFALYNSCPIASAKDVKKRPQEVQQAIDQAFEENKIADPKSWLYNGSPYYGLFGIDEEKLVDYLISLGKKDVYIMDVGCARGRWGHNIKDLLEKKYKNNDIKFHIFSITGGNECEESTYISDNVILHQFNLFKIENIDEELAKRNFDLKDKVDVIVSRWTLRHLVDPFGTVERLYTLLNPSGGKLLSNGFLFRFYGTDIKKIEAVPAYHRYIFTHSNATVLYRHWDSGRDAGQFMLERNNEKSLELPLHYTGSVQHVGDNCQCASGTITEFQVMDKTIQTNAIETLHIDPQELKEGEYMIPGDFYCLKGDVQCKDLYARLTKHKLFENQNWE